MTMMLRFNRQTLPLYTEFLIAGVRCLITTNSADILESTVCWRTKMQQSHCAASFEMEVLVDSAMENTAHDATFFRGHRHLVFAVLPPRGVVTYDLLRRRVHAVLSAAAACDRSFWNNVLLPITIGVLGTTVGVVPLHSACLDHNGTGVLVAGASGAGKSTLAAALAGCGFSFVSDDWTYISKDASALVAYGLSSPIKLLPDTVKFFPHLKDIAPHKTLNGELAYEIDPSWAGFSVNYISHPRRVLFLERTLKPGCDFVPCRSEYVREFFETSAERLPNELSEAKAFRASVIQTLSSVPAWILRTGGSPQTTAAAISDFILEAGDATN
jgi:hypothetical protein